MRQLSFDQGQSVMYLGEEYIIVKPVDLESILVRSLQNKDMRVIPIAQLHLPVDPQAREVPNIESLSKKERCKAKQRYDIIRPLLGKATTAEEVMAVARKHDVGRTTIYRWIQYFSTGGTVASLADLGRKTKGITKLDDAVEAVIKSTIESDYLRLEKPVAAACIEKITARCINMKLKPPHANTIRIRIAQMSEYQKAKRRLGYKKAKEQFDHHQSSDLGQYPLHIIEMDHTPLDIQVVDEADREVMGRPTLTLAIDTYSRMVLGFYVSFNKPSNMVVAMCLSHTILDKDEWMGKTGVPGNWPCWGKMTILRADNAREHHSQALREACELHGIELRWRRKAEPKSGGAYIERYLGIVNFQLHNLPGTTFSNVQHKADYDAEGKAIMSLPALQQYLTDYFVNTYHLRKHSGLGMPPIQKWNEGIFGNSSQPGRGVPARIMDKRRLLLDFMPYEMRTIQQYGVMIDYLEYWSSKLIPHLHTTIIEEGKRRRNQSFKFKYDPNDLSKIFFYDPVKDEYFDIPYADPTTPPMTLWQLRAAIRDARNIHPGKELYMKDIVASHQRREQLVEEERRKTKKAKLKKNRMYEIVTPSVHTKVSEQIAVSTQKASAEKEHILFDDIDAADFE